VPGRRSPVPARGTPVKAGRPSPAPEAFGVRVSQGHPVSRPVRVRVHRAALRVEGAVEEHAFDPLVVVEVLDVPQVRYPGRHVCACRFGAQWSETWRQSTAPALINATESASVQLYSPAATSGWIWRRIAASPLRFLDDTGSSNQVTSRAESPVATRTACPVVYRRWRRCTARRRPAVRSASCRRTLWNRPRRLITNQCLSLGITHLGRGYAV